MIKDFDKYNFLNFINDLDINFDDFNLKSDFFDIKSETHGINHTYRVMFMCLVIGYSIQNKTSTKRAFMSAFIHDMARKHDNSCKIHGWHSALYKLPIYKNLFIKNGMSVKDIDAIELAVTNHSENFEIDKNDPYYKTAAILRDADGLDLVRIDITIRPNILRFKESIGLIDFAERLFLKTDNKKYNSFSDFLKDNL